MLGTNEKPFDQLALQAMPYRPCRQGKLIRMQYFIAHRTLHAFFYRDLLVPYLMLLFPLYFASRNLLSMTRGFRLTAIALFVVDMFSLFVIVNGRLLNQFYSYYICSIVILTNLLKIFVSWYLECHTLFT